MKLLVLAFMVLGPIACHPAYLVKDNVIGPHGEKATEIECVQIEGCYQVAREQCQGDFDVVRVSSEVSNGSTRGQRLLYSCPAVK